MSERQARGLEEGEEEEEVSRHIACETLLHSLTYEYAKDEEFLKLDLKVIMYFGNSILKRLVALRRKIIFFST